MKELSAAMDLKARSHDPPGLTKPTRSPSMLPSARHSRGPRTLPINHTPSRHLAQRGIPHRVGPQSQVSWLAVGFIALDHE